MLLWIIFNIKDTTYRFILAAKILAVAFTETSNAPGTHLALLSQFSHADWSNMSHYFPEFKLFEHEKAQQQGTNFFVAKESMLKQSWDLLKQTSLFKQLQNRMWLSLTTDHHPVQYDFYCNLIGLI